MVSKPDLSVPTECEPSTL